MGTTDAEIRALSSALLRNDVHLEDFMHLIILASQVTATVRGLGLYSCVSCYVCLSIAVDAPFSFSIGGVSFSVEEPMVVGVRKDSLQKYFDHLGLGGLRVAGKIINNNIENTLGTCYATQCTRRCME